MTYNVPTRAIGVLWALVQDSSLTSAEKLSQALPECEKTLRGDLRALETAGFIKRTKYAVNGRAKAYMEITQDGYAFIFGKFYPVNITGQLPWNEQYKQNKHIPSTARILKDSPEGERKTMRITMSPYDFFNSTSTPDSDTSDARIKWEAKKQAEYQAQKARKAQTEQQHRESRPKESWTCRDIGFEFADRLQNYWHIPPWSVVQSRFIPALAEKRKVLNTNGAIEFTMMDMFFEVLKAEKYTDADHLWRLFLTQFHHLADRARLMMFSEQDLAVAKEQSDKSWEWMENE